MTLDPRRRIAVADSAEVDCLGRSGYSVAGVTQHRVGATQADDDGHVQSQDDDERSRRVGRQLDVLERSVHELLRHEARSTLRMPYHRTVLVSLCRQQLVIVVVVVVY